MLPLLKIPLMKKSFKNIFFLLIIFIQISSIKSYPGQCYSILNCEICPELDFCEKCLNGFILNKVRTKCISTNSQQYLINQRNIEIKNKLKNINNQLNNINQRNGIPPNKKPMDPFQNIPFKSIQQSKQSDLNRARINRLLIIIIIILAISITISAAYDFLKKIMNNNNDDYDTQDSQEESSKVVIR